jgi:hypothetical protein
MEKTEQEDVIKALSNLNLNFSDFEFKEIDITNHQENAVYAISGEIEVTYKPSKISNKYKTGHGSSWPAEFEFDIKTNFYRTRQ